MKGLRFYLEYPNKTEKTKATVKNPGNHSGNCIAVFIGQWQGNTMNIDAGAALMDTPNSPVCSTSVSYEYLQERCKRIPAGMVNAIHPELWKWVISD